MLSKRSRRLPHITITPRGSLAETWINQLSNPFAGYVLSGFSSFHQGEEKNPHILYSRYWTGPDWTLGLTYERLITKRRCCPDTSSGYSRLSVTGLDSDGHTLSCTTVLDCGCGKPHCCSDDCNRSGMYGCAILSHTPSNTCVV